MNSYSFIIIGAGAGGLFSARALVKAGIPVTNITILEKESRVGGKCHTYTDPSHPELIAEYGASLVAHNYGVVLDAIFEKKIKLEKPLPTELNSLDIVRQFKERRFIGKIKYIAAFTKEYLSFIWLVRQYKRIREHQLPLPPEFELPFLEFAQQKGLTRLNELLRPLVTGFGYGAMQTCPAFAVIEYMGYTTLAGLIPIVFGRAPFYSIQGGFQTLMEAIAQDFHIIQDANISQIDRNDQVHVEYVQHNIPHKLTADYLILALSPLHWSTLGLTNLTDIEQQCSQALTYYQYPITLFKIKGYPPQHAFFEKGLQPDGFGTLALITTKDHRKMPKDGRLCTAYINLRQNRATQHIPTSRGSSDTESFLDPADKPQNVGNELTRLTKQLASLPGVTGVEIVDTKIWNDYLSFLPWTLRTALASQQFALPTKTGYINACLSFEDVACIAAQATQLVLDHFCKKVH